MSQGANRSPFSKVAICRGFAVAWHAEEVFAIMTGRFFYRKSFLYPFQPWVSSWCLQRPGRPFTCQRYMTVVLIFLTMVQPHEEQMASSSNPTLLWKLVGVWADLPHQRGKLRVTSIAMFNTVVCLRYVGTFLIATGGCQIDAVGTQWREKHK